MKKLFIIAILSCNFLNAQILEPTPIDEPLPNPVPSFPLYVIGSPGTSAHVFFGEASAVSGQASAKLTFGGYGIQHAGFSWVPSTTSDNGKLHLSFGGSDNGMQNPIRATFQSNGNVGIGTTNPLAKFVVNASTEGQTAPIKSISIIGPNQPGNQNSAQDLSWDFNSAGSAIIRSYRGGNWDTTLQFLTNSYNGGNAPRVNMHISSEGLVGIGTANPGYKLDVIGTVRAREVKVDLLGADFVFEDGYKLMPLNEVEKFVKQNKHLPEIAPAKEMQENGSNLGSLSVQLLQKIEELTLHVIEQNKKMDLQNQEINLLKENMKKLQQK